MFFLPFLLYIWGLRQRSIPIAKNIKLKLKAKAKTAAGPSFSELQSNNNTNKAIIPMVQIMNLITCPSLFWERADYDHTNTEC